MDDKDPKPEPPHMPSLMHLIPPAGSGPAIEKQLRENARRRGSRNKKWWAHEDEPIGPAK